MSAIAAFLLAAQISAASPSGGSVIITVTGLRNARGTIRACMTRSASHFPDCSRDPAALKRTVSAGAATIQFGEVPPGDYAIAVFHDENDNGKLDTFLGIPKEGFGFSRNPKISFGAPQFEGVNIRIGPGISRLTVRMQYLL
jgi:uncharacterized protein (DUF2141 family)